MSTTNFRRMASLEDIHQVLSQYSEIEDNIHDFMSKANIGEKSSFEDYCVDKINYSEFKKTFYIHIDFYYISDLETIKKEIYEVPLEAIHSYMNGNHLAPLYWKHVLKGTE